MSPFLLDEQLDIEEVLPPLPKWIKVQRLIELRPREIIRDDRVPGILLTLKQPTFITIDQDFWKRRLCHLGYCILYFALRDDQQELLPDLLCASLRHPEFRTRAKRMGKVARVSRSHIDYWQFQTRGLQHLEWDEPRRRKN
jgi:hypothetical protein